jgi:hypothetical protein
MLLWELTFQKIPYQGWDIIEIQTHVTQGKREEITFRPVANKQELDIQKALIYIIREGIHKLIHFTTFHWITMNLYNNFC